MDKRRLILEFTGETYQHLCRIAKQLGIRPIDVINKGIQILDLVSTPCPSDNSLGRLLIERRGATKEIIIVGKHDIKKSN